MSTSNPEIFLAFRVSAMNVCAFLMDISSVMSSCTGTTADEEWMLGANMDKASSAAAIFLDPVSAATTS
jgi:hypothetical protein